MIEKPNSPAPSGSSDVFRVGGPDDSRSCTEDTRVGGPDDSRETIDPNKPLSASATQQS